MEKYLGNKKGLLGDIFKFYQQNCPDASSVFDIFAGTNNVARMFRRKGLKSYSNDANRFSYTLAKTYLELDKIPQFKKLNTFKIYDEDLFLQKRVIADIQKDNNTLFDLERQQEFLNDTKEAQGVFNYLNSLKKKLQNRNYTFYDYFSQFGDKSSYTSTRGTSGKRNYFSEENAILLDNILNQIKEWKYESRISSDEYSFLLTAVIEEVTLKANVNGTFHDFNRKKLFPNATQEFFLKIPIVDIYNGTSGEAHTGDSINISSLNNVSCDLLYIDPPYNFRQYTAYYHLLNFISAYPEIDDLEAYIDKLEFVRGQNPEDDFTSDFCFKNKFISALDNMIKDAKPKYVIMSYYGGRNHWNHWTKGEEHNDVGFKVLEEYFGSEKFCSKSYSSITKLRQNYQSRVGEKKQMIDEYLFFAKLN
jgi:adenine-specific DNA methylase